MSLFQKWRMPIGLICQILAGQWYQLPFVTIYLPLCFLRYREQAKVLLLTFVLMPFYLRKHKSVSFLPSFPLEPCEFSNFKTFLFSTLSFSWNILGLCLDRHIFRAYPTYQIFNYWHYYLQISSSHFYSLQLWVLLFPIHFIISTKSSNENFIVHP